MTFSTDQFLNGSVGTYLRYAGTLTGGGGFIVVRGTYTGAI
jgi:hypothetical protein